MRPLHFSGLLLATLTIASALAGCSANADGPDPSQPPTGCKKTMCDFEYDQCDARAKAHNACSECNSKCAGMGYEYEIECLQICDRVCSTPQSDYCTPSRSSCRKTPTNGACVDGVARENLPNTSIHTLIWKAPAAAHQGVCDAGAVDALMAACISADGSESACTASIKANAACARCMFTPSDGDAWGPLVVEQNGSTWPNDVGCVSSLESQKYGCGRTIFDRDMCMHSCAEAADQAVCEKMAREHVCQRQVAEADACMARLGVGAAGSPYQACALGRTDAEGVKPLVMFFCGG